MEKRSGPSARSKEKFLNHATETPKLLCLARVLLIAWNCWGSYLTFDASQAAAASLRFAEPLTVATTVLPGEPQLMQLPLFLLVDLLHTSRFEQLIAALGRVRLEKRALVDVGSTDVNILLWDVIHCKFFGLLTLLGSIFCQLNTTKGTKFICHVEQAQFHRSLNHCISFMVHTFSLRASSFSSLSLLRSFSRRRSRCSTANSASEYVRSALWRCIMPRVHPPRLGTLVKPWHRGKKNTVTWSNVTLPRRARLDFLRMDVAMDGKKKEAGLEYMMHK